MAGLLFLLEEPLLDDSLGGDAGVVGAGHPEAVVSLHASPPDQHILERVVQRVPQMEGPGDVGRRDHDAVRRPVAGRIRMEVSVLDPELVPPVLGVFGVILLGDIGEAHGVPFQDKGHLGPAQGIPS